MRILTLSVLLLGAHLGWANSELDNDRTVSNVVQKPQALPATLVVRVDSRDQSVAVLHSKEFINSSDVAQVINKEFQPMNTEQVALNELDKDSSTSGWYFWLWGANYSNPCYGYNGWWYNYTSYANWNWGYYNYWYYRW